MKEKTMTNKLPLVKFMLLINLGSILIVGIVLTITNIVLVNERTNSDYKQIATSTSVSIACMLESLNDQDFVYENEVLKKGDIEITDAAFLEAQEVDPNIKHTIFWGEEIVLSDLKDDSGKSVVHTTLTDKTILEELNTNGIYTANNESLYGSKYTVCYYPIKNGSTTVGYVFTGVNQDKANGLIFRDVIIANLITLILAIGMFIFDRRLVHRKSDCFNQELTMVSETTNDKRSSVTYLGNETNNNMEQINLAITQMSQAVTQQASHTEEIMGTMENFGDNLEVIMEHVNDTSDITSDSTKLIDELKDELAALESASKDNSLQIVNINKQIEEDNQAVEDIGQIVNVINDIAFQITILSFNASVEAARAGEAGKGFAVVADSIKELSDKTQSSVNDITKIIETVNEKMLSTGHASKELMDKNNKMVEQLVATKDGMNSVTDAFERIANNINEIHEESSSILVAKNQVVETVSSLAAASQENAAMSEEIASTSNIVINTTEELMSEINKLQLITEKIDQIKVDFS